MHEEKHFTAPDFVRDIVIGMSDGLTVPFALAAGVSAVASRDIIITAGVAEIAAGAIAMGLGGYLAGRTEVDHYESELKREYREVDEVPEREKAEIRQVFAEMGLSESTRELAVEELSADRDQWVTFMMKHELGLEEPDAKRAGKSAVNIGLSYIVGGIIPLSAYFFTRDTTTGLQYSCIITLICLLVFGYFKSRVTGQAPISGALRVAAIGAAAASAAYFVAKMVQ